MSKEKLTPAVKPVGKKLSTSSKTHTNISTPKQPTGKKYSVWMPGQGAKDKLM